MSSLSENESHSVVSDSSQPQGLYSPWNSLCQNSIVGSLFPSLGLLPKQSDGASNDQPVYSLVLKISSR